MSADRLATEKLASGGWLRVRRFQIVLADTGDVLADGAWFASDESVAVAYRGGCTVLYPQGIEGAMVTGRLRNRVEWLDDERIEP